MNLRTPTVAKVELGWNTIIDRGRLAQLVRAPFLHSGCRGFESLIAHQTVHATPLETRGFCVLWFSVRVVSDMCASSLARV